MIILVLLFLGDLLVIDSLRQNFGGWPWEFFQHGLDAFARIVCLMWIFAIAEALVSVGVIFYAHKGIRTSSAAVLRYVTGYASCKMFFEIYHVFRISEVVVNLELISLLIWEIKPTGLLTEHL